MSVLPVCMQNWQRLEKARVKSLGLELQMVVSYCGAGKQTQLLCKNHSVLSPKVPLYFLVSPNNFQFYLFSIYR